MSNSLFFKIKNTVDIDKHRLLEIFFKDWIDNSCNNEVQYKIEREWKKDRFEDFGTYSIFHPEIFRVEFNKQEDALALCLKGIPEEFKPYLEIVSQHI